MQRAKYAGALLVLTSLQIKAADFGTMPVYTGGEIAEVYGSRWWYDAGSGQASMPFFVFTTQGRWFRIPYDVYTVGNAGDVTPVAEPVTMDLTGEQILPYGTDYEVTDWAEGSLLKYAKGEDNIWRPAVAAGQSVGTISWENDVSIDNSVCACNNQDLDGDGVLDADEVAVGMDPYYRNDAQGDDDGDGYSNGDEATAGSNPFSSASTPENSGGGGGGDTGSGGGGDENIFVQDVDIAFEWLPESWRVAVRDGSSDVFGKLDEVQAFFQEQMNEVSPEGPAWDGKNVNQDSLDFWTATGKATNSDEIASLYSVSLLQFSNFMQSASFQASTNWSGSFTGFTNGASGVSSNLSTLSAMMTNSVFAGLSTIESIEPVLRIEAGWLGDNIGNSEYFQNGYITIDARELDILTWVKPFLQVMIVGSFLFLAGRMIRATVGMSA